VSEPEKPDLVESPEQAASSGTLAARLSLSQKAGGVAVPVVTVIVAFLIGGLVVLATGHNPLAAYRDIFDGAGLNWIFHPTTNIQTSIAGYNLTQTLLQSTTLIFTGLAVAFAFRCGMFNIGGEGQYIVGLVFANWIGVNFAGMSTLPHVLFAVVGATLAGAAWAGIAGVLKATTGASEVISTIMLNWIAIYTATWLFGAGGPLQTHAAGQATNPVSADIAHTAELPVFWGSKGFQGLDIGFFIAIGALVVFWALINRTTLGYEVRAVGFNPDAAAYGGINVKKNIIRAMAISGAFAGLGGAVDMLGYLYHYGALDVQNSAAGGVGFIGIAVALLGRNTAVGVFFGSVLFGALIYGTGQGLSSSVIQPELASNVTLIIQGLVVLFIGADILILYVWNSRKRLRPRSQTPARAVY
jgi:general nucleoside transport system permease protein